MGGFTIKLEFMADLPRLVKDSVKPRAFGGKCRKKGREDGTWSRSR